MQKDEQIRVISEMRQAYEARLESIEHQQAEEMELLKA
jgi:hypothetical protein